METNHKFDIQFETCSPLNYFETTKVHVRPHPIFLVLIFLKFLFLTDSGAIQRNEAPVCG
jgi:UDP-N-acetylglucosamine 2-epimerase